MRILFFLFANILHSQSLCSPSAHVWSQSGSSQSGHTNSPVTSLKQERQRGAVSWLGPTTTASSLRSEKKFEWQTELKMFSFTFYWINQFQFLTKELRIRWLTWIWAPPGWCPWWPGHSSPSPPPTRWPPGKVGTSHHRPREADGASHCRNCSRVVS